MDVGSAEKKTNWRQASEAIVFSLFPRRTHENLVSGSYHRFLPARACVCLGASCVHCGIQKEGDLVSLAKFVEQSQGNAWATLQAWAHSANTRLALHMHVGTRQGMCVLLAQASLPACTRRPVPRTDSAHRCRTLP